MIKIPFISDCSNIISSKNRFGLIYENNKEDEKTLFEMIDFFTNRIFKKINLLIIEGYKNEPIQKLEIYRHELEKPLLYKNDKNIFALASNKDVKTDLPLLDLNNINEISRFIKNKFLL